MDHCPPKMVKASGDSLGFLLILKMEIVNIFLIEVKLLANFLKYAIVCTLKKKNLQKSNKGSVQVLTLLPYVLKILSCAFTMSYCKTLNVRF